MWGRRPYDKHINPSENVGVSFGAMVKDSTITTTHFRGIIQLLTLVYYYSGEVQLLHPCLLQRK
ncbi:hypothetical protein B4U79_12015 [Dinothrombium tinctorium]|uniref:Uncharacterized protein n=1 Tax=Dinothrombium tinctorium TaxID=1965070 RepID=A0A3S3PJQ5_9ACAR|nr:hypothetical protein B4U79_12015 [Dinothrombium tinctorium]